MSLDMHDLFVAHLPTLESPGLLEDGGVSEVILPGEASDCIVGVWRSMPQTAPRFNEGCTRLNHLSNSFSLTKVQTFVRLPPCPWRLQYLNVLSLFFFKDFIILVFFHIIFFSVVTYTQVVLRSSTCLVCQFTLLPFHFSLHIFLDNSFACCYWTLAYSLALDMVQF